MSDNHIEVSIKRWCWTNKESYMSKLELQSNYLLLLTVVSKQATFQNKKTGSIYLSLTNKIIEVPKVNEEAKFTNIIYVQRFLFIAFLPLCKDTRIAL